MKTNTLAKTAERFIKACSRIKFSDKMETFDLSEVLNTLPHLHLDEKYTLECLTPGNAGMGGESIIYALREGARRPQRKDLEEMRRHFNDDEMGTDSDLDPIAHVSVEICPEGMWEFHLFLDMWRFLPLWWHANYEEVTYITDADKVAEIAHVTPELIQEYEKDGRLFFYETQRLGLQQTSDVENAINLCGDEIVLPAVRAVNGGWEVTYCYWSEWGGLSRVRTKIGVLDDASVRVVDKARKVTLVNYDCGICF